MNKSLLKKSNKERWDKVLSLCKDIKRCGSDIDNGCGCLQPSKIKKKELEI